MQRLGVVGTMVWDTIYARDAGRAEPVEEWGGIAYALSAFEAGGPDGWSLFPIVKIGADLRREADRFLAGLGRIDSLEGVRTVPEPNNRVELHYRDRSRRCEKLRGGVPGWTWEELAPLARSCDALYVNFIAGWEMDLACARRLRAEYARPLYADIHSLLLGVGPDGVRVLRKPSAWREWLACFDVVQINEDELETLAEGWGDPWRLAAEVVGPSTLALLVTLGKRGAAWVATTAFWRDGVGGGEGDEAISGSGTGPEAGIGAPGAESGARSGAGGARSSGGVRSGGGPVLSGRVEPERVVEDGDPTGCGDVWGMICFTSLLAGQDLETAVRRANRLAARNAELRGATSLARRTESGLLLGEDE